jgi:hypothetical protein
VKRDTAIVLILLAIAPCVCFWEVFQGQLLLPTDWVYRDLEPWKRTAEPTTVANSRIKDAVLDGYALDLVSARGAAHGRVVLWNRYAGGGVPHLAGGFSRMLYPPFWIYAVAEPETARNVEILLHLFLAEVFAFLFLRRIGASRGGAWFGAIAFAFTPSLVHRAEIPFIFPSLVWFPFLLYCIEGLVATGKLRWTFALSLAVACQLLAGHFPDIFLHFAGAGLYGVVRIAQLTLGRGERASNGTGLRGLTRFVLCLAGVAFGASLAAPFLLPAFELIEQANRPTTPLEELMASGLTVKGVAVSLFSPWFNRSQLYIGLAALVFVPVAFGRERGAAAWALAATTLLGVAIATGSPMVALLHGWVPGFENLKYVRTHISLASFSLALLSGIGVCRFLESKTAVPGRLALGVAAGLAVVWGFGSEELWSILRVPGSLGVAAMLAASTELYRRHRLNRYLYLAAVTCVLAAELFSYARKYNPRTDPRALPMFPEFPSIAYLDGDEDRFRVASLLGNYETPFWPNTLGAYGIEDVAAYHSLLPGQVGRYMARVNRYTAGANPSLLAGEDAAGNWLSLNRFRPTTLVRLWNIKYFALPSSAPNPDPEWLELAYDGEIRLFRDRSWFPRAWLADAAIVLPSESGISTKLLDARFDPLRTVILNEEPVCAFGGIVGPEVPPSSEPTVEILAHEGERIVLRSRSPRFNFLVLSETFYPGWVARVDGVEVPVLKANMNFRAIGLTPGTHEVILTYQPASFRWGVVVAGVSVALLSLLLLSASLRDRIVWTLALSLVPLFFGVVGWQRVTTEGAPRSCGQLQLTGRLLEGENSSAITLRNATLPGSSKANRSWPSVESGPALLDFRIAPGEAAATLSTDLGTLLSVEQNNTQPRWLFHRAMIPEASSEITLETTPSTVIGGAFLFEPGPRRQSRAVFLSPDQSVAEVGLEPDTALRVLVMRDSPSSSPPSGFDVVYESAREDRFTERLLAVAADLYRFETLVVVKPELEGGDGAFTERQHGLLARELDRLEIADAVVLEPPRGALVGSER